MSIIGALILLIGSVWFGALPTPSAVAGPPGAFGEWTVDDPGDETDAAIGDGTCDIGNGVCTLRAALGEAQNQLNNGSDAVVNFASPVFGATIELFANLTLNVPAGRTLTILGPNRFQDRPAVSGRSARRHFDLTGGGAMTISGITLEGGRPANFENGGAIRSTLGSLTLDRVKLDNNVVGNASSSGGAVYATGDLAILNSIITGNQSNGPTGIGGAISVDNADLVVRNSSIAGNGGFVGRGGAIGVTGTAGTATITDSLINNNSASNEAGAVYCNCASLTLERVSVVSNSATSNAGAIRVENNPVSTLTVINTTVTGNSSASIGAISTGAQATFLDHATVTANSGPAPAIAVTIGAVNVGIRNSILFGNSAVTAMDCGGIGYFGAFTTSIIEGGACTVQPGTGSKSTANPLLTAVGPSATGHFMAAGAPMPVVSLLPASPAIGAASCALTVDGRNLPRPTVGCDLGAVEMTPAYVADRVFVVNSLTDDVDLNVGDGVCAAADGACTLRAAVLEADSWAAPSTITFTPALVNSSPTGVARLVVDVPAESWGVCPTLGDNAFCGDLDVENASLTIAGISGVDVFAHPPIRLYSSTAGDRLFEIDSPSVVFTDLTIEGTGDGFVKASGTNQLMRFQNVDMVGEIPDYLTGLPQASIFNAAIIADAGAPTARLELDNVLLAETSNSNFDGTVISGRDLSIHNSHIIGNEGGGIHVNGVADVDIEGTVTEGNFNSVDSAGIKCGSCSSFNLRSSTVLNNISILGSTISVGGTGLIANIENSTIAGNAGRTGGVDASASTVLNLNFSTITGNTGGSGPGTASGGIFAGGAGTTNISNSIIYGNTGQRGAGDVDPTSPDNCIGTANLVGINAIPAAGAGRCTYTGAAPFGGDPQLALMALYNTPPLGPSAYPNIPAFPLQPSSPLIDAVASGQCNGTVNPIAGQFADARGLGRPSGLGCEPGAVETGFIVASVQASDTAPKSGASKTTITNIPSTALSTPASNGAADLAGVSSTQLRGIDLEQTAFKTTPLRQVPLGALAVDTNVLDSISLDSLPLRYSSLTNGTGWVAYMLDQSTATNGLDELATQPLNTVTLGQVIRATTSGLPDEFGLPGLDMSQIDFSKTPLGSLPIGAIALGGATLDDIGELPGADWCTIIAQYSKETCGSGPAFSIDLSKATLVSISLQGVPLRQVPLRQVPLRQVDLSAAPLRQVPLRQVDMSASPLRQVPLRQVDLVASPLRQVPLRQVDIVASPLRQVPLRQVLIASTPLRQVPLRQVDLVSSPLRQVPLRQVAIGASPLRQVPLRQVGNIGSIVDCSLVDCASQTLTLGDLPINALIGTLGALFDNVPANVNLGTLGDMLAATVDLGGLGEIGGADHPDAYGSATDPALVTLADLIGLFGDTTLGDIGGAAYPDAYGDATIADFLALLQGITDPNDPLYNVTLGDLLSGVLPPSELPWQNIDLETAASDILKTSDASRVLYQVPLNVALPTGTDSNIELRLPKGFEIVPGTFQLKPANDLPGPDETTPIATFDPVFTPSGVESVTTVTAQLPQGSSRLVFYAVPPFDIGPATSTVAVTVTAPRWNISSAPEQSAPTTVGEAFEPNNTVETATPFVSEGDPAGMTADQRLFLTHISSATDVDWFSLNIAQGNKLSVFLGNLPADYDVLLYGPTQTALRGTPSRTLLPSPDGGLSLISADNVVNPQLTADIPTAPPNADWKLYGVSSRRGAGDERIDTATLPAGTYAIKVVGFNGATDRRPYSLRVRTEATAGAGACTVNTGAVTPPSLPANVTTLTAATNTLVLTNLTRLQRAYPSGAASVATALTNFVQLVNGAPANYAGTSAAVVTLDDLSAYAAWDANACDPKAANAVVTQIGARIDSIRATHPNIKNIVLLGADDQIPFARVADAVPDHNESEYASTFNDASPLKAALSLGYLLSDNPYGASHPIAIGTRELFVPELAVGRLVESPVDVNTALKNFTDFHGRLDPATALSTGYDFLSDGATEVAKELKAPNGLIPAVNELISNTWTRDDLRTGLVGPTPPDIASVNAHFDHYRALPADQDEQGKLTNPFQLSDVSGAAAGALTGSVIFSMGCHAALSVSDASVGGTLDADWAQTFSEQGAIFIGNTGYGYGDDTVVGATEELMRQFAKRLNGTMTIGDAMVFAKQKYTADAGEVVSPFDEKVVSQVVFYGLPMYRLGTASPPAPPVNPPTTVDPTTGLNSLVTTATLPIAPTSGPAQLHRVSTPSAGDYFEVNGEIQATSYQPVQPRVTFDVTQAGKTARGSVITALTSSDVPGVFNPVYFTPTDDVTATNPEANVDGAIFPSVLQTVNQFRAPSGARDQLVVIPGQFRDDPSTTDGSGVQRLFTSMTNRVYYAPAGNTDTTPPTITTTNSSVVNGTAAFTVTAADDAAISRVLVLFTDAAHPGTWAPLDLQPSGGTYTGSAVAPAGATIVDYMVQVVDTGGNVTVSSNKGDNFAGIVNTAPDPGATRPVVTVPPAPPTGVYTGAVIITMAPGVNGGPVTAQVDGGPISTGPTVTVTGTGVHTVVATGSDGTSTTVTVVIDSDAPTLSATAVPAPVGGVFLGATTVTLTAADVGSGVASITYSATGAHTIATAVVPGSIATIPLSVGGATTITATAKDVAGNVSATSTLVYTLALSPPTIAATVTPVPPASGWNLTAPTVKITATAGAAPVASISYRIGSAAFTTVNGSTVNVPITTQGTSAVQYFAKDTLGRVSATGTTVVKYDSVAPTATVSAPSAGATYTVGDVVNATFTCADATSGIAPTNGCVGTVAAGQPINTGTIGTKTFAVTATDAAGKTTTVNVSYVVAAPKFVPGPLGSFTVKPNGAFGFGPSAPTLASQAWLTGPGNKYVKVTGPLQFTTTGTAASRSFGVAVGSTTMVGINVAGYAVEFDPGYDCGTKADGGRIGALVIQPVLLGLAVTGSPLACTPAPTDLYSGNTEAKRIAAASSDRNAKYWAKPMTINVTVKAGATPGVSEISGTITSAGPTGAQRTISVKANVSTASLGTSIGLRATGDLVGTVTPTVVLG